ncbi:reverse transcriptase domain-containing protein [Tanacetum coccineum]
MADNRTMAELLQAPTEGYEDAIVIPEINANFELKHGLINLVQNKQFFGHDKEDPHAHIRYFNKITSTMRFPDVPSTSIKLMLFPFSLEGSARIWLEKEPPRSILTWDDLVSKFINQFFPPSKTTNLRNEITRFQQRFDESFYEAWDRFNDLLRAYSLNSVVGGNFLDKMRRECLRIIKSKSKVRNSRNKAVVAKVSSSSSTPGISPDVAALTTEVSELTNMIKTMLIDKQKAQALVPVKLVEQSCVTCGANFNQGNTNSRPPMVANQIRPPGFPLIQNRGTNFNQNRGNNFNQGKIHQPPTSQPPVYQAQPYQAPAPQMQGVSKNDFENYVKANDAVLRNMQNQGQGAILWNPSIRKFSGIEVPYMANRFQINKIVWGFGVRPDTLDPTIVNISMPFYGDGPWHVLLYTLNSDTWRVLGNARLPRIGIRIKRSWGVAVETIDTDETGTLRMLLEVEAAVVTSWRVVMIGMGFHRILVMVNSNNHVLNRVKSLVMKPLSVLITNNETDPWEFGLDIDDFDLHLTPSLRSSNSTHVESSTLIKNPVTIIHGPAGVVQLSSNTRAEPYPLTSNPIRIIPGPAGDIDNFLKKGKLDHIVAIVKSCSSNMLGDLNVTLKDISSTIPRTIHHKVIEHYLNITMRNVVEVFRKDTVLGSGTG